MTASMNIPLFPLNSLMIASIATNAELLGTTDFTHIAGQYGALGMMTVALGAFSVWMEKNRRKGEKEDREERKLHHDALIKIIEQKDAVIHKKDTVIEGIFLEDSQRKR